MAFRHSVVACWLFLAAAAYGQTLEELRAKLQQSEIDKAVMIERARNSGQISSVFIAFIAALPALWGAWLTFEGNKLIAKGTALTQSLATKSTDRNEVIATEGTALAQSLANKSTARAEVLATERTGQHEDLAREMSQLQRVVVDKAEIAELQASQIKNELKAK